MKQMTRKEIEEQFEKDNNVLERWLTYPRLQFDDDGPSEYWIDFDGARVEKFAPEPGPPAKNELVWCVTTDNERMYPGISRGNFTGDIELVTSVSIDGPAINYCEHWYCPRTGHHSPDFPMHMLEGLPK